MVESKNKLANVRNVILNYLGDDCDTVLVGRDTKYVEASVSIENDNWEDLFKSPIPFFVISRPKKRTRYENGHQSQVGSLFFPYTCRDG